MLTPDLPPHCTPTNWFLTQFSSTFSTCIPTSLAFISTTLGCLSILSWLFAQLPQIIKNHRLKSTSGLSIAFLVEWCLGDLTNLFGALLTGQATWQVVVGAYYCFVDFTLVVQWIWFEALGQGAALTRTWVLRRRRSDGDHGDMQQLSVEGMSPASQVSEDTKHTDSAAKAITRPGGPVFLTPNYGSFRSTKEEPSTSSPRTIYRVTSQSNPLPSPSPRTVLLISMALCLASTTVSATPTPQIHATGGITTATTAIHLPPLGTLLSWSSTTLYLVSRLPQLIKNFRLRSTAGLSPLLFAAAFCGNMFYSSSLLLNPCLWNDFPAYGGGGWAGPAGSERAEWALNALPFFLGAAGVLVMDACIGVQFWLWAESGAERSSDGEGVLVLGPRKGKRKSKQVDGWMRGWVPSARLMLRRASSEERERQALLGARTGNE